MRLKLIAITALTVISSGCVDTNVRQPENMGPLLAAKETGVGINQERPSTYIKRHSAKESRLEREVTLKSSGMPLARILSTVVPNMNVRIDDPGVDLSKETVIYANEMPLGDFFDQLTSITGYAFKSEGRTLTVSSDETKTWDLSSLSSNRRALTSVGGSSGFSGDSNNSTNIGSSNGFSSEDGLSQIGGNSSSDESTGTRITSIQQGDPWKDILSQIRGYVGLKKDENSNDEVKMASVRRLGTVTLTAPPERIKQVDDFLTRVARESRRQIHLDVKAFEVTLDDNRARGINWDAVLNTTIHSSPFQLVLSQDNPISLSGSSGSTSVGATYTHGNDHASSLVKLLGHYGNVSLLTEPNLTELNGGTAYLSSVQISSFVASVTQFLGTQGTNTVTPQLSRVRVGVSLSLTSHILPDNRIQMEVTPVISSLQGYDSFDIGEFSFQNPRIALSELSTTVITRPGQPVQIGGLITSRIANAMNRLPTRRKTGLLNWLFSSESNELKRREMVISITPTLTET